MSLPEGRDIYLVRTSVKDFCKKIECIEFIELINCAKTDIKSCLEVN